MFTTQVVCVKMCHNMTVLDRNPSGSATAVGSTRDDTICRVFHSNCIEIWFQGHTADKSALLKVINNYPVLGKVMAWYLTDHKPLSELMMALLTDTVETLYNTINFCWSTHKRHSIARPKGRGMGCLLWVQRATYCVDLSIWSSIKYLL